MEQFVVRNGLEMKSLADFEGKKLFVAPGRPMSRWPRLCLLPTV